MTITLQETNKTRINHEIRMLGQRLDKQLPTYGNVKFPSTAVPSTDANTLDDYEEGSFTPGIAFGGGSTGITYTTQIGRYTKIGNMVFANLHVQISAVGSDTGNATITGLPFATATLQAAATIGYYDGMSGLTGAIKGFAGTGLTTIALYQSAAAGTLAITQTVFTTASRFYVSIAYRT